MDRRQFTVGVAASAGMFGAPALAADGLLKFIYPYAPGSGGDILVRVLADDLQKKLGISAIVDNKPGADGRIGAREVKHAAPDGNTLLFTPFGTMVLFPTVFKSLPYDAFKDFAPVTQALTFDFGLAAGPMSGAKTLAELTEWLKKNPDKGNVGVPGLGALPHLLPLKYAADAGVKLKAIAYKGTAPALTAAMSGETALVCAPLADLIAQHKAGAIHLLATSGRRARPTFPTCRLSSTRASRSRARAGMAFSRRPERRRKRSPSSTRLWSTRSILPNSRNVRSRSICAPPARRPRNSARSRRRTTSAGNP